MPVSLIILILTALFLGALMRATFGFGDAMVSMPLLALLPIDLSLSISLAGLSGLTAAAMSLSGNVQNIDKPVLYRLGIMTLSGIPAGVLLILFLPAQTVKLVLGVLLIIYILSLKVLPSSASRFENPSWALPFGFLSGMLGSAYNFNGLPVAVYATLRKMEPLQFRSTLQAQFLFSGFFIVIGQALGGFWSRPLFMLFLLSLPVQAVAVVAGNRLFERIPAHRFSFIVYTLIFILGVLLILEAR